MAPFGLWKYMFNFFFSLLNTFTVVGTHLSTSWKTDKDGQRPNNLIILRLEQILGLWVTFPLYQVPYVFSDSMLMQHVHCVCGRITRQTKHCSFWSSRWIVIFRRAMLSFWWCWALYFIWDPVGECVIKYCSVMQISDQKMCICGRAGVAHSPFKSAANGRTT